MQRGLLIIVISCWLAGCGMHGNVSTQLIGVSHAMLDSVMKTADTTYTKKYGTSKFANAAYFANRKDSTLCQVMKDTADSIRQIIITKKNRRIFFAEYYPTGQLVATLPLDSFGQYQGHAIYYYPDGIIESAGEYKSGLKTGAWKNNDEKGKLINTSEYDQNGQVSKVINP